MYALVGGFGNVLGPPAQMLSHSSVEYSRAASHDRQDGHHLRESKDNTLDAIWAKDRAEREREQRREFFIFRGHSQHH